MTIQELYDQAVAHHQAGRIGDAVGVYRQVLDRSASHADALHMMGIACHQMGGAHDAIHWIRRAIAVDPTKAGYHINLGNVLRSAGDLSGAIGSYREALSIQPDSADAWNNLGNALQESGKSDEAIDAHQRAIAQRSDFVQAWYSLGGAYNSLHRLDAGIEAYERALRIRPDFDAAQVNRANLLRHVGRLDESIDALQRLTAARPTPVALSNLIYGMYFHPDYDTQRIGQYLSRWNDLFARGLGGDRNLGNARDPERRLRVGYVSPDFDGHPAGRFFLPLAEHHNHGEFEIFCYSDVGAPDEITEQLKSHADVWCESRRLLDEELAQRVRDDGIDILVDLTLHLSGNRMLMFARSPAPIQATWLGYPGSSGLTVMDYRISDSLLDPAGMNDGFYSEKTVRLPDCYWCYQPQCGAIAVGSLPAKSNGYVTFGCLNNFAKVTGETISLWARVMVRVGDSRLLVLAPAGSARTRFLSAMQSKGVDSSRIEFADRLPRQEYMELYRGIDVGLDTFPCNGHTTTFDSLWMGVPVVSLIGTTAMSRGGLSIASNLGMGDWAAQDGNAFVEVAVRAGLDLDRLAELRSDLRGRMESSVLMDGKRFARNMEQIYRGMWTAFCQTDPPAGG